MYEHIIVIYIPLAGVSGLVGVCGALAGGGGGGCCDGCGGGFGCETNGNALFESVELPTGLELDIGFCSCSGTCADEEPATPVIMLPPGVAAGTALGRVDGLCSVGSGGVGVRERDAVAGRLGVNGSVSGWAG